MWICAQAGKPLVRYSTNKPVGLQSLYPDQIPLCNTRIRTLSRQVAVVLFPLSFSRKERRKVGRKEKRNGRENKRRVRQKMERATVRVHTPASVGLPFFDDNDFLSI